MPFFHLTKDNLEEAVKTNEILLIDFWAEWCAPCKVFGPVFEAASKEHPDIGFAGCDTGNQQEVAALFQIRSIPTLAVFKEQIMIFRQAGVLPPAALADLIRQTKDLDMDEVRKKNEEEQAKKKHAEAAEE